MTFYEPLRDPIDNSIVDYYHWKSRNSTGSSTTIFDDIVVPSSPNFPASTASRYILNLPGEIYHAGVVAGTHPFVIKDVNTSTILTRVEHTGTLTANTYKIFPATAESPHKCEIHVGIGSCQPSDAIAFDGYFLNSILSSTNVNDLNNNSITSNYINANNGLNRPIAILKHVVYSGIYSSVTQFGWEEGSSTATSFAWNDRKLNTEIYDQSSIVTLSSNIFILSSGIYKIDAKIPIAYYCGLSQSRLYNLTDSSVQLYSNLTSGTTTIPGGNRTSVTNHIINDIISLDQAKSFIIQTVADAFGVNQITNYGFAPASSGWGSTFGYFSNIVIEKLG